MTTSREKNEGHRIDYFIHAMRKCGCRFDSGQMPVFRQSGVLEFWEGGFFYRPGRIDLVGKVTLDHNFITMKWNRVVPRRLVKKFREELHLLMTTNQCHYYFEPTTRSPDDVSLVMAKYVYAAEPPEDEIQVVLDMMAHAVSDLQKALADDFKDWRTKHKV